MILIALGSNLPSSFGTPRQTCEAALSSLGEYGVFACAVSQWYRTAPVPRSDDPWYVNGVAHVETILSPSELLQVLLKVESKFGRHRSVTNAPRTLDLDLLAYDDVVLSEPELTLPHPRMGERAFVLLPLADIAPCWRNPVNGVDVQTLIGRLAPGQEIYQEEE